MQNPLIVERDVVRIAAMRPTMPATLSEVVENRKWISRYAVKKAIICNPYTPVNTALSLLGFMMKPDLREIATNQTVSQEVRRAAKVRAQDRDSPNLG